jgi:hypothetical protein
MLDEGGVRLQLGGRAAEHDLALGEHDVAVGEREHIVESLRRAQVRRFIIVAPMFLALDAPCQSRVMSHAANDVANSVGCADRMGRVI